MRFHTVQQATGSASQLSGRLMAGQLAGREGQRFSAGFRSGLQGGGVSRERVSGTTGAAGPCRPAPPGTGTAWGEEGNEPIRGDGFPTKAATLREISARRAFIASVLRACGGAARTEPKANSTLPQPHRTFATSQDRSQPRQRGHDGDAQHLCNRKPGAASGASFST